MPRILRMLTTFTLLIVLIGAASASHTFRHSFHCYRPFDSLSSFSLASMQAKDNCWLDYMRIQDAGVAVKCYDDGKVYASATSGDEAQHGLFADRFGQPSDANALSDRNGCYATMFIKAEREGGHNGKGFASDDEARYAVKLHTKGGGEVHYKGMDGMGYSACCSLLNQPQYSSCEWRNTSATNEDGDYIKEQHVQYCLMEEQPEDHQHDDSDPLGIMGGASSTPKSKKEFFVGSITKPLHRQIPGMWTMELLFYRGHNSVGKVVSDFNVTREMVRSSEAGGDEQNDAIATDAKQNAASSTVAVQEGDAPAAENGHHRRHHKHRKGHHHKHHKEANNDAQGSSVAIVPEKEEDLVLG